MGTRIVVLVDLTVAADQPLALVGMLARAKATVLPLAPGAPAVFSGRTTPAIWTAPLERVNAGRWR